MRLGILQLMAAVLAIGAALAAAAQPRPLKVSGVEPGAIYSRAVTIALEHALSHPHARVFLNGGGAELPRRARPIAALQDGVP